MKRITTPAAPRPRRMTHRCANRINGVACGRPATVLEHQYPRWICAQCARRLYPDRTTTAVTDYGDRLG